MTADVRSATCVDTQLYLGGRRAGEGDSASSSQLPWSGVEVVGLLPKKFYVVRLLYSLRGELKGINAPGFG